MSYFSIGAMFTKPLHILLVEDNPTDACFIQELIKAGVDNGASVVWVRNLTDAMGVLAEKKFDAVISDLNLHKSWGLNTLHKIIGCVPYLPVVVISGMDDERLRLDAIRHGAQAYLLKGQFDSQQLIKTLRKAILRKKVEETIQAV